MISSSARRPLLASLTLALVGVFATGCGENPPASDAGKGVKGVKGGKGGGGAAPVLVGQVKMKIVPLVIDAIGAVEPIRTTAVRSQVTGTLLRRAIQEGQDVKQGDLLFEIDPRPFQNALQSAEADLQKVRVQLETARAQVARYRALTTEQMVSKEQFEKITDTARALESEVLSDESRLATARLQLEYSSIRAPLAGRTGNMSAHEGDIVRSNDTGTPLVTINQISPIYVTFGVPQQYLAALTRYRATGTLKLKGSFPNASHRLWPGQFATVTVTLSSPEALTVPGSAVQTSQTGQHVFVVKADKTAELRPVVVERIYENDAVIAKGLAAGETVIIDGQLRVIPGKAVEIKDPAAAGGAGRGKGGAEGGKGKKKEKEKKAP